MHKTHWSLKFFVKYNDVADLRPVVLIFLTDGQTLQKPMRKVMEVVK